MWQVRTPHSWLPFCIQTVHRSCKNVQTVQHTAITQGIDEAKKVAGGEVSFVADLLSTDLWFAFHCPLPDCSQIAKAIDQCHAALCLVDSQNNMLLETADEVGRISLRMRHGCLRLFVVLGVHPLIFRLCHEYAARPCALIQLTPSSRPTMLRK